MTQAQIALFIREQRKLKGWSQAKLAELTNCTQPNIANYENGRIIPDYLTLKKIIEKLGGKISILAPIDQDEAELIDTIN